MKDIKYNVDYDGHVRHITVQEPNECPICKHSLKPTVLYKTLMKDENENLNFYIVYLCTNCYKIFICQFTEIEEYTSNRTFSANKLSLIEPNYFQKRTFDDNINELSPDFVKIYNQAYEAEHLKLDQLSGIGYRKALEFLIKDFLIKHENKDSEKVKTTALGNCINTMIDNPQLKTVASRATWLGNDQTHYEQKYQDKDISDLKRLIDLSVHWITMIYLTDEAEAIERK